MLSNVDILKELGQNLDIFPFQPQNVKGASVHLTASSMAWTASTKQTAYNKATDEIVLKSQETTLVLTEEIFSVSDKIGGTFHSRVAEVSLGLGHISTVINPGWTGRPLIAVNNYTLSDIKIKRGESFVIMVLDYLNTPTSIKTDPKISSRLDVLHDFNLTKEEKELIFKKDIEGNLHERATKQDTYETIKEPEIKKSKSKKNLIRWITRGTLTILSLTAMGILLWFKLYEWLAIPAIIATATITPLTEKIL